MIDDDANDSDEELFTMMFCVLSMNLEKFSKILLKNAVHVELFTMMFCVLSMNLEEFSKILLKNAVHVGEGIF